MKKLITYALWGNNLKYTIGALRNCEMNRVFYPEFISQFHVDLTVPKNFIWELEEQPNTEVVFHPLVGDWTFSMKRFDPLGDKSVELFLSRDCDSRPSKREQFAVTEWIDSGKDFHIMRDHPRHGNYPILAGMFGARGGIVENYQELVNNFSKINYYHTDQDFLKNNIYPKVKNSCMIHDEFFEKKPFPTPRLGTEFVGDVFDENECRNEEFWKEL